MIQTLQSLRFVFIMLIVFSHIIGKRFDYGGECGVSFFFMLSGFVLSLAYGTKVANGTFRTRPFLFRQLLKFYPLHLLMLVAFVVFDAHLGKFYDWQHLLPSIFLLQSWIPLDEYYFVANGSSWFLCDILFFYLVFSCSFRLLNRLSVLRLAIFGMVLLLLYIILAYSIPLWTVNSILYASPLTRLADFGIGILLCRMYRSEACAVIGRRMESSSDAIKTVCEMLLVVWMVMSFFAYESLSLRLRCAALFWLFIPPVILYFSVSDRCGGVLTRLLRHPVLLWLGGISLEIYLMHMLVLRGVNSMLLSAGVSRALVIIVIGLAVMVPVAWLTKRFFVDKIYVSLIKHVE